MPQTNWPLGIGDPLIVSWPKGIKARGERRTEYSHIIDIATTVPEAARIPAPRTPQANSRRAAGVRFTP